MVDHQALLDLKDRIGTEHFSKRLQLQTKHSALRFSPSGPHIYWENLDLLEPVLKLALQASGLLSRATRNSIAYQVETVDVHLPSLPLSFDGFRILHLSDLHLEGMIDRGARLRTLLTGLHYDLCVITGDFRYLTFGGYDEAIVRMADIASAIRCSEGTWGILGNHDFMEMVPGLEKLGIRMLLNESIPIRQGRDAIWMVGVDDTHYYEVHDLAKALTPVPADSTKILLAHSAEIHGLAYQAGIDYYLCGHSHGGQLCLPGGTPILNNSHSPRRYIAGAWTYRQTLRGYTSRGTGTSLLPVRLSCPPELTIHCLRRGS